MGASLPVEDIFLQRQAVPVDLQQLDRALKRLWAEGQETLDRVTRACVLTLVVYARDQAEADRASAVVARLIGSHPCRAVLLLLDETAEAPELRAWLSAHCQLPRAGGQRVCCEQIMLEARGETIELVPSVVLPLLVPDLPVVLWWPGDPPFGSPLFEQLADAADHLIVDTVSFEDSSLSLARLAALIRARAGRLAVSDLNWARLTPWQDQVAQIFDSLDTLPYLDGLERLTVRYAHPADAGRVDPEQALLLAGWLLNRLGWKMPPALARVGAGHLRGRLRRAGRELTVEIAPSDLDPIGEHQPRAGHLMAIELRATSAGRAASFRLNRELGDKDCVTATIAMGEVEPFTSTRVFPSYDEADLLNEALATHEPDYLFEAALQTAAHLGGAAMLLQY